MEELQFNGIHLALVTGAFALGFDAGFVSGWLRRDDREDGP